MAENKNRKKEEGEISLSGAVLEKILNAGEKEGTAQNGGIDRYAQLYEKQADRAAENVFGLAANRTGGYGNSYGATAAASVYGDFADRLAEKQTEIEKAEYERQKDSRDELFRTYNAAADYEKRQADAIRTQELDELSFALSAAENGDYSYLENMGIDTSNATRKQALDFALNAAKSGDYSYLNALGIDTASTQRAQELAEKREQAEFLAKYGDYSGLSEMGVDISRLTKEELAELAQIYAKYGDYSLLKLLGVNTASRESDDAAERRLAAARYYKLLR